MCSKYTQFSLSYTFLTQYHWEYSDDLMHTKTEKDLTIFLLPIYIMLTLLYQSLW